MIFSYQTEPHILSYMRYRKNEIAMIAITPERKNEKTESKECIGNTYFM